MPSEKRNLLLAALLLIAACTLFMTLNAHGNWGFVLPLRATKLLAILLVAYAIGISTLLFQTLTNNPILTPSLLGFDTLYVFLQTLLVLIFGSIGYVQLDSNWKFGAELLIMLGGSLLLFQVLLREGGRDLARMILIGVIFGIFFRSITSLMQRLIDPEEFAVVQSVSYASFNSFNQNLLLPSLMVVLASMFFIWRERHRLDVHMLGRDQTINLGIPYQRNILWILVWVAVLVATATALVGPFGYPVSFFGLLVCALANHFAATLHHSIRLPMSFLIAALLLVGGQTLFEHVLGMQAVLSVVVEFAGGLVFLYLILRKKQA
ncbi:iron chelate uptake ABC transporter family permease subunit [Uruburuella testudinis]|uniref:Iron chelate uptake ABC transporter family permease subunit n=1 Tax=Uruburuella testudinis TaxID=1282863 RepID=A0ABY4DTF9_9NEIS|nr:iron chelate uptake ABC transporter family permease subunit [Uruburuella testudinis]UOO81688.1 iron chelate uptake ABC transporter family permease subunit [Uruburuella testudinis]